MQNFAHHLILIVFSRFSLSRHKEMESTRGVIL